MSKELSTIKIHVTLKGQGVVNFDSTDQQQVILATHTISLPKDSKGGIPKCMKIAKASYVKDSEGNFSRTSKVSSQCLRQGIYKQMHNPNIIHSPALFNDYASSKSGLMGGYMFAREKTAKRKSPLTVIDAHETSGAVPTFGVHSNSGDRNDTSLYYVEEVGQTRFETDMFINLSELQFIPLSDTYGRNSVFPDGEEPFKAVLRSKYGSIEEGYYAIEGEEGQVPEYGVKLPGSAVCDIVKDFIGHLKKFRIDRANSYLEFDSAEFFIFENGKWVRVDEPGDFTVNSRYVLVEDQVAAKKLHDDVCTQAKEEQAARKAAKNEEKAKKAAKKAEKKAK